MQFSLHACPSCGGEMYQDPEDEVLLDCWPCARVDQKTTIEEMNLRWWARLLGISDELDPIISASYATNET